MDNTSNSPAPRDASLPRWAVTASFLASAALGVGCAVLVHTLGGAALLSSMAQKVAVYASAIWQKRSVREAFSFAVTLSRADIAWIFISQLFPLTGPLPARLLSSLGTAIRSFLSAMAFAAVLMSPYTPAQNAASAVSVAAGFAFTLAAYRRIFVSADGRTSLRTAMYNAAYACACSGGIILFRTIILAAVGAYGA